MDSLKFAKYTAPFLFPGSLGVASSASADME